LEQRRFRRDHGGWKLLSSGFVSVVVVARRRPGLPETVPGSINVGEIVSLERLLGAGEWNMCSAVCVTLSLEEMEPCFSLSSCTSASVILLS